MAGGNFFKPPVGDAQANFRYGLACGADAERERIVALLRARFPRGWDYAERDSIESVIALIEGQTIGATDGPS